MHHSLHKAPAGSTVARTLTLLVLVHFAAGWVLGWLTQSSLPTFIACVYLGLFHSQTGLLGVWGGLGPNAWPIRLFGLLTGVAYLAPQLCFGLDEWSLVVVLIVFFSTMGLAAVLLGVRWRKGSIRRMRPHDFSEPEGLQFSIGHLMLITVGVALLITVGKMVPPLLRGRLELAIVIAYSLCFISVALLCT